MRVLGVLSQHVVALFLALGALSRLSARRVVPLGVPTVLLQHGLALLVLPVATGAGEGKVVVQKWGTGLHTAEDWTEQAADELWSRALIFIGVYFFSNFAPGDGTSDL